MLVEGRPILLPPGHEVRPRREAMCRRMCRIPQWPSSQILWGKRPPRTDMGASQLDRGRRADSQHRMTYGVSWAYGDHRERGHGPSPRWHGNCRPERITAMQPSGCYNGERLIPMQFALLRTPSSGRFLPKHFVALGIPRLRSHPIIRSTTTRPSSPISDLSIRSNDVAIAFIRHRQPRWSLAVRRERVPVQLRLVGTGSLHGRA